MRADGTWLIEPKFEAARVRDVETAFVTISGATGLLRLRDGSWVIPPRPGAMCSIISPGILSRADRRRTFFSPAGEVWIDIESDRIDISLDLGLLAFRRDGRWGLVDTAGKAIVEPTYDLTQFLYRGIAWARRGDRWCAIERRGRPVPGIACETRPIEPPTGLYPCTVEG
jgi:hypothetical protein